MSLVTYLLLIVTISELAYAYLIMIPRESLLMHDCCFLCSCYYFSTLKVPLSVDRASTVSNVESMATAELQEKARETKAKARSFLTLKAEGAQALWANKLRPNESSGFMPDFRYFSLLCTSVLLASRLLRGVPIHQSTDPLILWRIYSRWGNKGSSSKKHPDPSQLSKCQELKIEVDSLGYKFFHVLCYASNWLIDGYWQ